MDCLDLLNKQGTYSLVLNVNHDTLITTKQFRWSFIRGIYLYFGSAFGKTSTSLGYRLNRHLRKKKKIFWHIDYLTSLPDVEIILVFYSTDSTFSECNVLKEFKDEYRMSRIISNFGSSDCKSGCGGHLLFLRSWDTPLVIVSNFFIQKGMDIIENKCD